MSRLKLVGMAVAIAVAGCQSAPQPTSTPSASPTKTASPPATSAMTVTPPVTVTPAATLTPTPSLTSSPMPTPTPTVSPTQEPTPTPAAPGSWQTLAVGPHGANYDGLGPVVLLSNGQALALWVNTANKVRTSIYDPPTDTWTNSPPPPCTCLLVALPDGNEVAINDYFERPDGQPDVTSYVRGDPSQAWVQTAQLPDSRDYMLQVGLPDNRVLVVGGLDDSGSGSPATDFYDPAADTWTPGPQLPFDNVDSVGVLADGSVLVLATSGKAARLDPGAGDWIAAGKASVGAQPVIAALGGGAIALAGSGGRVISSPDRHTALYDETANSWSAGPSVPKLGDLSPGIAATAVQLSDGRLLLVGGTQGGDFSPTRGAAILAANGSSWASVASAPADLGNAVGELMPDGSVLFAGEAADFNNDIGPYLGAFRFTP